MSESEDEHTATGAIDIDSRTQFVDIADDQVPHPSNPTISASEQASHQPNPENQQSIPRIEIVHYPSTLAGAPVTDSAHQQAYYETYHTRMGDANDFYMPFHSKMDWEVARWVKSHCLSATATNELLAIDGVSFSCSLYILLSLIMFQLSDKLGLSFKNARELNSIMDYKLPRRPHFESYDIKMAGETVTVYARNIISCIKALYGDATFAPHLIFQPEHHYEILGDQRHRVYHDMHTGDWWWEVQVCDLSVLNYQLTFMM